MKRKTETLILLHVFFVYLWKANKKEKQTRLFTKARPPNSRTLNEMKIIFPLFSTTKLQGKTMWVSIYMFIITNIKEIIWLGIKGFCGPSLPLGPLNIYYYYDAYCLSIKEDTKEPPKLKTKGQLH